MPCGLSRRQFRDNSPHRALEVRLSSHARQEPATSSSVNSRRERSTIRNSARALTKSVLPGCGRCRSRNRLGPESAVRGRIDSAARLRDPRGNPRRSARRGVSKSAAGSRSGIGVSGCIRSHPAPKMPGETTVHGKSSSWTASTGSQEPKPEPSTVRSVLPFPEVRYPTPGRGGRTIRERSLPLESNRTSFGPPFPLEPPSAPLVGSCGSARSSARP